MAKVLKPIILDETGKKISEAITALSDVQVPVGGKQGNVLTKNSDNDRDVIWKAPLKSYNDLEDKPVINGRELIGEQDSHVLGLQKELVSGISIKTVNNTDLLGAGNITIDGVTDYTKLTNKPSINGTTLEGDITLDSGKIDDIQINGTSIVEDKVAYIMVDDTAYEDSENLIQSGAVLDAINNNLRVNATIIKFYSENYTPLDLNSHSTYTGSVSNWITCSGTGNSGTWYYCYINNSNVIKQALSFKQAISNITELPTSASAYDYCSYSDPISQADVYFIYLPYIEWKAFILDYDQRLYNPTITITQNDTTKGSFTLNQDKDTTIELAGTTYDEATTSTAGLMSASDKSKLDNIDTGANKTIVDDALSSTSTNPVQNKVINTVLENKADTSSLATVATSGSYDDLTNKPTIPAINAYSNIAVSVTPTKLSSYEAWDTNNSYGYSATISITGITEKSVILNSAMSDTLLNTIAGIIDTNTDSITVYTGTSTALSGTIYSLVTIEVN